MGTEVIIAGRLPLSLTFCHLCNHPDFLSLEGCVLLERLIVMKSKTKQFLSPSCQICFVKILQLGESIDTLLKYICLFLPIPFTICLIAFQFLSPNLCLHIRFATQLIISQGIQIACNVRILRRGELLLFIYCTVLRYIHTKALMLTDEVLPVPQRRFVLVNHT